MKHIYCIIILLLFFYSCQSKSKKEYGLSQIENIATENLQAITVEVEDFDFEKLGDFLETTSYIQLAAEPLLTSIQEVQIKNEKIYVHDRLSRIICYDMQGNVIYKIDAKGAGPGEYTNVNAFVVNEQNRELVIFDNFRQSLFHYDADNGAYIKMQKLGKPDPTAMASLRGVYYYDNRYHNNYANDTTLYYSLLISKDGTRMVQRYFPHNEAESSYYFTPGQPFSYNDSVLYYCKAFDSVVYELSPEGLEALYEIELPNPLPFSKIEDKADEWNLMKSEYSIGLEKICRCNDLLYFQFSKDGFLQLGLYDLAQKKQIYCGKRLTDKVGKSVPVFRLIDGVYKGKFWGIITPETVDYALSEEPNKDYPDIIRNYNPDTDNPIIAFYNVAK
ncbi:6-bladed beta-propeller [Bacteroides intestinalis]|uniref:6-bladed beta-propeller n=1 Tax=Bacteroides intestinalis TaxID=329854 RepID=UPI001ED9E87D|nr:6-bladed beta-propeller [Bacteroides intestinalis]MCG4717932.1 6-bladed beta-propeller [Bacteroides intestinalis]